VKPKRNAAASTSANSSSSGMPTSASTRTAHSRISGTSPTIPNSPMAVQGRGARRSSRLTERMRSGMKASSNSPRTKKTA